MTVFQQFFWGLKSYPQAMRFIGKNKLTGFFVFPVIINMLYYFTVGMIITKVSAEVVDYIAESFLQAIDYDWIKNVLEITLLIIMHLLFWLISIFIGGQVVLMLMSPVLAYLSEKTEKIITQNDYPFDIKQFVKDIIRGIGIALYNLYKELLYTVVIFIIGWIPVIGFLAPVFSFLMTAYFFGFSFIDYVNERKKISVKQSIRLIEKFKGLAVAHGILFALMMMIPIIGASLAGFVSIISTVAATISVLSLPEYEKRLAA